VGLRAPIQNDYQRREIGSRDRNRPNTKTDRSSSSEVARQPNSHSASTRTSSSSEHELKYHTANQLSVGRSRGIPTDRQVTKASPYTLLGSNVRTSADPSTMDTRFALDSIETALASSGFETPLGKVTLSVLLGEGTYGKVYSAQLTGSDGTQRQVAVKFQKPIKRWFNFPLGLPPNYGQIEHEFSMMKLMRRDRGFTRPHAANFAGKYKYYITDLIGQDLFSIMENYNYRVPLREAISITRQILSRIRALHDRGYIGQDIHPGNFLMDFKGRLYMIDLAFAFPWQYAGGVHIPDAPSHFPHGKTRKPPMATRREERDLETSRADDLERMLYILIQMLRGSLPWKRETDKNKAAEIKRQLTANPGELCRKMKLQELTLLFDTVFKLKFYDDPPYDYIDQLLKNLIH
jgi:hypothetical protein